MTALHQRMSTIGGFGLLTTITQLPPKYRNKYYSLQLAKAEINVSGTPLDLTVVKQQETTTTTTAPMTPPPSPLKRKYCDDSGSEISENDEVSPQLKIMKAEVRVDVVPVTPTKPIKVDSPPKTAKVHPPTPKSNKNKVTRKLKFDEDTSSPVSGTIIRPLEEINDQEYSNGDIDPKYNIVEVTEEAKAELAAIKNVIGDYTCKLCRITFDDAFELARHRCACIVLLEYRCPECGKRFNCPANLASHRRWHKPRKESTKKSSESTEAQFSCGECGKLFKRQAYLKKHLATHIKPSDVVPDTPKDTEEQSRESSYDSRSDYSSSPGPLQIIEHNITEDESIAVSALANLRNCTSVIRHTNIMAMAH